MKDTDLQTALAEAQMAYTELRLQDARSAYEDATVAVPDSYEAHLGLARTLMRMRQQAPAATAAYRCIELDPKRFEGHLAVGVLQFLIDDLVGAQESLGRARELAPEDPEAYITLAQVLADTHEFDTAEEQLADARERIAALPIESDRLALEAMAFHAETYLRLAQGDNARAIEAAHEVIDLRDANPYAACLAYSNLGILSTRAKQYDQAIEYLQNAFEMNPFFYRAGSALGRLLVLRKQPYRAAEILAQVVATAPATNGRDRYAYAVALAKSKQRAEARTQFQQALTEGLTGIDVLTARWQMVWLSEWGRYLVFALVMAGVLAWILVTQPSGQSLVLLPILAVIVFLQWIWNHRR